MVRDCGIQTAEIGEGSHRTDRQVLKERIPVPRFVCGWQRRYVRFSRVTFLDDSGKSNTHTTKKQFIS